MFLQSELEYPVGLTHLCLNNLQNLFQLWKIKYGTKIDSIYKCLQLYIKHHYITPLFILSYSGSPVDKTLTLDVLPWTSTLARLDIIGLLLRKINRIYHHRVGQGNPIGVSLICSPWWGLQSPGCCKSWSWRWDSSVPSPFGDYFSIMLFSSALRTPYFYLLYSNALRKFWIQMYYIIIISLHEKSLARRPRLPEFLSG